MVLLDDTLAICVDFWLEIVRVHLGFLRCEVFFVTSFETSGIRLLIGV